VLSRASDQQGVFQVVNFFQQMRRFGFLAVHGVAAAFAVPHVPLVEREPQLFGERLWPRTRSHTATVSAIWRSMVRFIARNFALSPPVVLRIVEIAMQREAVDVVVALLKHFAIPLEITWACPDAGAARNELSDGSTLMHLARGVRCFQAVFRGGHVADLPRAVHFVAQAPILNFVGFRDPCLRRSSLQRVPFSTLQYSTRSAACSAVPVPRFKPISGSVPASLHQARIR